MRKYFETSWANVRNKLRSPHSRNLKSSSERLPPNYAQPKQNLIPISPNTEPLACDDPPSSVFPDPLVFYPSDRHEQTFILLHGKGSNAKSFAPTLLNCDIPELDHQNLRELFPNTKFVFPTAPWRRTALFDDKYTRQWFDTWKLDEPKVKPQLQIEGLRETSEYITRLINEELAAVGAENIVLGGISQGCAASLISLLTWDGRPIKGVVGMCGYLPFVDDLGSIEKTNSSNNNNKAGSPESQQRLGYGGSQAVPAIEHLHRLLDLSYHDRSLSFKGTPIFLGHGTLDRQVSITLGRSTASLFSDLGVNVTFREYDGLGHWYSDRMLSDIAKFLGVDPTIPSN